MASISHAEASPGGLELTPFNEINFVSVTLPGEPESYLSIYEKFVTSARSKSLSETKQAQLWLLSVHVLRLQLMG